MALAPNYSGHRYGSIQAAHYLEVYLDYVEVFPYLDSEHPNKVQFILRQQVQPWHPSSTIVHEAALAVEKIDKTKFFEFSAKLFESQKDYFDESVQELNRNQINKKLAKLAESVGISPSDFLEQLHISSTDDSSTARNVGNKVTNDLKIHIKLGRQEGIHVSPTVLWDGLVDNNVSSGWTLDQWKTWLADKI
ncbi:5444_t:CDS:2 [Ambispora gerdemannii]|uniref:5444_t:CDS:1 n=1 Tax=Ambispora gerdemannii TaxID=144530 RepID=A0A9N8ZHP7_9GLOM|nr:5444_t:CDS:2 [Ambispora gerdemannii]